LIPYLEGIKKELLRADLYKAHQYIRQSVPYKHWILFSIVVFLPNLYLSFTKGCSTDRCAGVEGGDRLHNLASPTWLTNKTKKRESGFSLCLPILRKPNRAKIQTGSRRRGVMVNYNPLQNLPSSDELPDCDDTPVDNELQILVPALLRALLSLLWRERNDWFFGFNMGVYHATGNNPRIPIIPDGFLSLGVERRKGTYGRKSYVVWEENGVVPIFVLECVSHTYGGEYEEKIAIYARLGVLYYAIYNPQFSKRDQHDPLEVYRLVDGEYVRQPGEPVWMPEIGLGIGREIGTFESWQREWLYWYDREGMRFPTPDEVTQQERQRAEQEQQRAERLAERLRAMGIDPEQV
jgi:Uma2 family endonuclease